MTKETKSRRTPTRDRAAEPRSDRRRRSAEEARRLILSSAQALIAEHGPDAIGLKEVARAAGVSHGLVTHYFGTYEGLVEEALSDHLVSQRLEGIARIRDASAGPEAWLEIAFEQFAHPLTIRLLVWAMLTGRLDRDDFVVLRTRGLAATVDVIAAYLEAAGRPVEREALERSVLVGISAVIGYTLGRNALWGALGKRANAERDAALRAHLARLLLSALPPNRAPKAAR